VKCEQIHLTAIGATRQDALASVERLLEQYAPAAHWDHQDFDVHAHLLGSDGSVRLWRVDATFMRQDT
jgi:hypothetical protein